MFNVFPHFHERVAAHCAKNSMKYERDIDIIMRYDRPLRHKKKKFQPSVPTMLNRINFKLKTEKKTSTQFWTRNKVETKTESSAKTYYFHIYEPHRTKLLAMVKPLYERRMHGIVRSPSHSIAHWLSTLFPLVCAEAMDFRTSSEWSLCVEQLFVQSLALCSCRMPVPCLSVYWQPHYRIEYEQQSRSESEQNLKRFFRFVSVLSFRCHDGGEQLPNWKLEKHKKMQTNSLVQIGCSLHSPSDFQSRLSQFREIVSDYFDVCIHLVVCYFS